MKIDEVTHIAPSIQELKIVGVVSKSIREMETLIDKAGCDAIISLQIKQFRDHNAGMMNVVAIAKATLTLTNHDHFSYRG